MEALEVGVIYPAVSLKNKFSQIRREYPSEKVSLQLPLSLWGY